MCSYVEFDKCESLGLLRRWQEALLMTLLLSNGTAWPKPHLPGQKDANSKIQKDKKTKHPSNMTLILSNGKTAVGQDYT